MRILIIILLEIFVLASYTIGEHNSSISQKLATRNYKNRTSNKRDSINPSINNSTSKYKKSPNDLVANAVFNLGINIFQHTAQKNNEKIQVISPSSIAGATALIELGSNRKTFKELMNFHGQTQS